MHRTSKSLWTVALATALPFFAASPAQAQGLVSIGAGSYVSPSNPSQTSSFVHFIWEGWNGRVHGRAIWFFPDATIVASVTSYEYHEFTPGTTSLAFAGAIRSVYGTPAGPLATVGRTVYAAVNDNGWGAADETTGMSLLPPPAFLPPILPQFGDLTTIQQLLAFFEYYSSIIPGPVWAPLVSGNIRNR